MLFACLMTEEAGFYSQAFTNAENADYPAGAVYVKEHRLRLVEEYEIRDTVKTNRRIYCFHPGNNRTKTRISINRSIKSVLFIKGVQLYHK